MLAIFLLLGLALAIPMGADADTAPADLTDPADQDTTDNVAIKLTVRISFGRRNNWMRIRIPQQHAE